MRWAERGEVRWLEADLPDARVAFSTRSAGPVEEDPSKLVTALGLPPERITTARQVHGAELSRDGDLEEADGHVISEPGTAGVVFVADCLPVAVRGPGGVAILHCGWRGLAAGIVARGVEAVNATHAAIGPGIGPCCYEVGDEVLDVFAGLGEGISSGRMLDLTAVADRLLRQAGVEEAEVAGLCTSCNDDMFFSHRRNGEPGRQAGLVWLEEAGS